MSETAPPPPKKMLFKPSALSATADKLWSESKSEFVASNVNTQVHLEKKKLGDVLSRMASEKNEGADGSKKTAPACIFGSNIAQRVTKENINNAIESKQSDEGATMKTAEELFKNARETTKKLDEDKQDLRPETSSEEKKEAGKEKQLASTSLLQPMTTGEENDINIYQVACKIHSFDNERKTWVERGLSVLKINRRTESGVTHHRIVARTQGTLKVVINSKLFADMFLERLDKRRIKLSAFGPDSPAVQIFLVTIGFSKADTGTDSEEFYNVLSNILQISKGESSRKRKALNEVDVDPEKVVLEEQEENVERKKDEGGEKSSTEKKEGEEGREDEVVEESRGDEKEAVVAGDEGIVESKAAEENTEENGSEDDFVLVEKPTE